MPGYSVARDIVLILHIAAAVFLLGPLVAVAAGTAPVVRRGADGLGALRWLHRSTRLYAVASVLVLVLGVGLVGRYGGGGYSFSQGWLSAALALFVVATVIMVGVVLPAQRSAVERLAAGEDGRSLARRISLAAGVASLLYLVVLCLMVLKPGVTGYPGG